MNKRGIDISKLTNADKGRWVLYWPGNQMGRIKSWRGNMIFVVYHADKNWDEYENYTAASTHPKSLEFIEEPKEKP